MAQTPQTILEKKKKSKRGREPPKKGLLSRRSVARRIPDRREEMPSMRPY